MPKQPDNKMKVQLWREGLSAKFEGTCLGATIEAFRFLNVEQQKRALEKMQEIHAKVSEKQTADAAKDIV